jgi:hypothetical protein
MAVQTVPPRSGVSELAGLLDSPEIARLRSRAGCDPLDGPAQIPISVDDRGRSPSRCTRSRPGPAWSPSSLSTRRSLLSSRRTAIRRPSTRATGSPASCASIDTCSTPASPALSSASRRRFRRSARTSPSTRPTSSHTPTASCSRRRGGGNDPTTSSPTPTPRGDTAPRSRRVPDRARSTARRPDDPRQAGATPAGSGRLCAVAVGRVMAQSPADEAEPRDQLGLILKRL